MEDFPFNFNLNYKIEDYIIKPPPRNLKLKEAAAKKYDIKIEEMVFIPENDEEMIISNEQEYADLIEYASAHNLSEIDILINREKENNEEEEENENDEGSGDDKGKDNGKEIGMNCDYDYYGDTRNRRGNNDEGYNKHNKGFKEQKRIGYIIEKKQMQREETLKNKKKKMKNKIKAYNMKFILIKYILIVKIMKKFKYLIF